MTTDPRISIARIVRVATNVSRLVQRVSRLRGKGADMVRGGCDVTFIEQAASPHAGIVSAKHRTRDDVSPGSP